MENLLKQLREESRLTQDNVAEQLGVTVNTIQNWERTGKIAKEQLHELLDLYGVDQMTRNRVVLSVFGDKKVLERRRETDNFPVFLFSERADIVSAAKEAVLSAGEMELFGYSYYISRMNAANGGPRRWPMEYSVFKDYGGYFHTMKLIASIERRIGEYFERTAFGENKKRLVDDVYDYGAAVPGADFSFCQMPKEWIIDAISYLPHLEGEKTDIRGLYEKCMAVKVPVLIGTSEKSYICNDNMPELIKSMVSTSSFYYGGDASYTLNLDEICGQCITIEKTEYAGLEYLERKKQYLSDKKVYDAHPDLYDREPAFRCQFQYWVRLTELGEAYIRWVEM